ncbi:MAG: flavodoxin family protein [Candidatus Methanomethylophilus sp.]|nr:flavodoxin family protein [Methanomethylophilus sp.]MDD4221690.1 flavodoxin family protein [Methanomethylophilus sp.]MDD4668262.1 flavodoxin family protein [Methanomethylophilus sp.]
MKILAINGSPRLIGNTTNIVGDFLDRLNRDGFETEQEQIYGYDLEPCNDCRTCEMRGDGRCINEEDGFNNVLDKLRQADGIVLAAPAYQGTTPCVMRNFLERAGLVLSVSDKGLRGKVGCALTVCAHDGGDTAYAELIRWMMQAQMVVVGAAPAPVFRALNSPQYAEDKDAVKGMDSLAENFSWAVRNLAGRKER